MRLFRFLFFSLFLLCLSTNVYSQKILAFDKSGKVKRIKYYEGEFIKLKTVDGFVYEGVITQINDSSFFIDSKSFQLSSVKKVYNTQKLYGFRILGGVFITAGAVYFPLDSFNKLINNDDPLLSTESAAISEAFLGTGFICAAIANRGYKISSKRPLKIIDLTI